MKVAVEYMGGHAPKEIFEVEENKAKDLIRTGAYRYVGVDKAKEKPKEAENKVIVESNNSYKNELIALKGIGKKTAEDIIRVYPFKEKLIENIKENKELPFDDDVVDLLKEKYE